MSLLNYCTLNMDEAPVSRRREDVEHSGKPGQVRRTCAKALSSSP